jgi:hypothetical protein
VIPKLSDERALVEAKISLEIPVANGLLAG